MRSKLGRECYKFYSPENNLQKSVESEAGCCLSSSSAHIVVKW